jgi:hypothetical protein
MKLSQDQIQQLYKFTRSHYVEHYDLQTELVDHLAHGIEQLQEENPSLSFQEALNLEFKKFGVFGFHDVIKERKNAVGKKYRALLWRFFKEWFQFPKIIKTIAAIFAIFGVMTLLNNSEFKPEIILTVLVSFMVVSLIYLFRTRKDREFKMVKNGRKFMLGEMIYELGSGASMTQIPLQIGIALNTSRDFIYYTMTFDVIFSIVFVLISLCVYVTVFVLPSKAEKLLEETYPEYKMI